MGNKKLGLASTLIICVLLIGIFGTSVAFAASGYEEVGGGIWTWKTTLGVYARSNYFHRETMHRASAQVGAGAIVSEIKPAGISAIAEAWGLGTTRVWWYVY